jgi:threonine/homoserine/homoserine lactone efflux protein
MTELATFILGSLALLATPGPTNTLLATAGATAGFRRSLRLLGGELGGYLLAIAVLLSVVGPLVAASPAFGVLLRALVCLYLLYVALMLWRQGELPTADTSPITVRRVFVTTLLNPKAIIFAFTLLPHAPTPDFAALLPWLAALSSMIVMVGAGWIALGASLIGGLGVAATPRASYRVGAVALVVVAGMIGANTVAQAIGQ